jgi:DCN1-like protein 1/2
MAPSSSSRTTLTKLFEKYAGREDTMDIEQLMPYFSAIGADPSDISALVAQEIVQSPEMGAITKQGFLDGWAALGADTIDKQKKALEARVKTIGMPGNREVLKQVYKFAFELCITQQGQRLVTKEELVEFWRLLFSPPSLDWRTRNTNWIELWIEFVNGNSAKAFNRDVWSQTFRFAEETLKDDSLSWWNEEASWPAVIDEFVEWIKEKRGIGGGNGEEDEDMEY